MIHEQLKGILQEKVAALQQLPYQALVQFLEHPQVEQYGEGKDFYQVEVQVFFDDGSGKTSRNIRVMASIDDGGITGVLGSLTEDFIMTPEGHLV
jgi:hypothetical protein